MRMTKEELEIILEFHKKWVRGEEGGKSANLSGADLSGANLSGADLYGADLSGADLYEANLSEANLSEANLSGANLSEANLSEANLYEANLSGANLSGANLYEADLSEANLYGANLYEANLSGAANLLYPIACPEVGSFTAFKKAKTEYGKSIIIELLIPETAKRLSATTRKCRASEAQVVRFWNLDRTESNIEKVRSSFDKDFWYEKGETVVPKDPFCDDRWVECSCGIHFFLSFDEAVNY